MAHKSCRRDNMYDLDAFMALLYTNQHKYRRFVEGRREEACLAPLPCPTYQELILVAEIFESELAPALWNMRTCSGWSLPGDILCSIFFIRRLRHLGAGLHALWQDWEPDLKARNCCPTRRRRTSLALTKHRLLETVL